MIGTGFRFIFSILLLPGADATLVSLSIVDAFVGGGGIMIQHATLLQKVCNNAGPFSHYVSPAQALKMSLCKWVFLVFLKLKSHMS